MITISASWVQRILHALREVELDLQRVVRHDNTAGIEQVVEDVAVLRKAIEMAIEASPT
jgi:hypothetical protein